MALRPCAECGAKLSTKAVACPSCGAKPKKPAGCLPWGIGIIVAILLIANVPDNKKASPDPAPVPLTAEEQAAKTKDALESNARFVNTAATLRAVKNRLRDPKSVEWIDISASQDGKVVCLTYRARNGFGGLNVEHAAMAKDTISNSGAAWNKNCAGKSLYEAKSALHAID
jgi:hypothetical protein